MDKASIVSATNSDKKFVVVDRNETLYSDALFLHGDQVLIQHHGEHYCLRRTCNDKLILTK